MTVEVDPHYPPYSVSGLPPSPTIENPAGVFPSNDPLKATTPTFRSNVPHFMGNPFLMRDAFGKLDHSLGEMIAILEDEEVPQEGVGECSSNELLRKLRAWREELDMFRGNKTRSSPSSRDTSSSPRKDVEGGMFLD
ncbi:hypothetical protein C8J56DRAFT_950211 [Mycena floridula]|nr:hypothetical protein C8J56DRAFT_950211 [Mycena floridula]